MNPKIAVQGMIRFARHCLPECSEARGDLLELFEQLLRGDLRLPLAQGAYKTACRAREEIARDYPHSLTYFDVRAENFALAFEKEWPPCDA